MKKRFIQLPELQDARRKAMVERLKARERELKGKGKKEAAAFVAERREKIDSQSKQKHSTSPLPVKDVGSSLPLNRDTRKENHV